MVEEEVVAVELLQKTAQFRRTGNDTVQKVAVSHCVQLHPHVDQENIRFVVRNLESGDVSLWHLAKLVQLAHHHLLIREALNFEIVDGEGSSAARVLEENLKNIALVFRHRDDLQSLSLFSEVAALLPPHQLHTPKGLRHLQNLKAGTKKDEDD